ncbi:NAD-dependent dehydratase [Pararobbsia alpina]|uniref:SDR family oxidoreductase n=1 Tax=Pararobbsia alpina TaxID=621374 RepID=UPI0039A513AE
MSILLIGATGRTGWLVAEKLHASAMPFRALIRNASKSEAFARIGGSTFVANLDDDFSAAFEGMQAVIYAAGSAETEGAEQERLIDRDAVIRSTKYAKDYGVPRFVVISALLASAPEQGPEALRHYAQMKRESDDHVMHSGLDYLVVRPGPLSMDPGVGSLQLVSNSATSGTPVAREDVASLVVEALKAGVTNKVIGFVGGNTRILDALSTL